MPALEPISDVYLDGIRLTTDPRVYTRQWPKRGSAHAVIGGVTLQDFGRKAKDFQLRLESSGNFLTRDVVDALDARFGALGTTYAFKDWNGTEAVVKIIDFTPVDTFLPDLFEYALTLRVVSLTKLRGVAYGGDS
jgi:hypothetical protein